jgi:hypothetical protein
MALGDADLALLECIAKFEPKQNIIDVMLAHPLIKSGFSALSRLQLENRIKQYKQVDGWLDMPSDNPPTIEAKKSATLITVKNQQTLESEMKRISPLRLSTHFGLVITPQGYSAWSAIKQKFVALNASEAAIILAFGDGKTVPEVIAKKQSLGILKKISVRQCPNLCLLKPKQARL